jgi:hypothetical protein
MLFAAVAHPVKELGVDTLLTLKVESDDDDDDDDGNNNNNNKLTGCCGIVVHTPTSCSECLMLEFWLSTQLF